MSSITFPYAVKTHDVYGQISRPVTVLRYYSERSAILGRLDGLDRFDVSFHYGEAVTFAWSTPEQQELRQANS